MSQCMPFAERVPIPRGTGWDGRTFDGVKLYHVAVKREEWKLETLLDLLETLHPAQVVVFCNSRETACSLAQQLRQRDVLVSALPAGPRQQAEREVLTREFRAGASRLLITCDAPSGSQDAAIVINYELPSREMYLRCVGRTGKFGRRGIAISLVTEASRCQLEDLEQFFQIEIAELPMWIPEFH